MHRAPFIKRELKMTEEFPPRFIAHVREGRDGQFVIHDLEDHLRDVATLAEGFARDFESGDWAKLAGLWHDLGKYSKEFQRRIKSVSGYDPDAHLEGPVGRVDHSTAGAQHAIAQHGVHGRILAYLIAGHHAGLPDWHTGETGGAALSVRLDDKTHLARAQAQPIPPEILLSLMKMPTAALILQAPVPQLVTL